MSSAPAPAPILVDDERKKLRWFEIALVLWIATGPLLISNLALRAGVAHSAETGNYRFMTMFVHELGSLLLLWYVLQRSNRSWKDLGFSFRWPHALRGLGLGVLAYLASYAVGLAFYYGYWFWFGAVPQYPNVDALLAPQSLVFTAPMVLLNPFFEELIVRGYLMTELTALTNSRLLAAFASVAVQTTYHLYQGWHALSAMVTFVVWSIYYARTRKLFPVVLAHSAFDTFALVRWFWPR